MNKIISEVINRSAYWAWGDVSRASEIPASFWPYLKHRLGVKPLAHPIEHVPLEDIKLPEKLLPKTHIEHLRSIVGEEGVSVAREDIVEHASGKSYPDVYRVRTGDASHGPAAVVFPDTEAQLQQILAYCAENKIAVVPFGGGTSVVGGVEAEKGSQNHAICVDLRNFNQVEDFDRVSGVATLGAGLRGSEVEAALNPAGWTMGHYPQSHQEATVGGYVTTRSVGQSSTGYGRSDDLVIGLRIVTKDGIYQIGGKAPASATGPGILQLLVGSEGIFGIVSAATMRLHRLPTEKLYAARMFPSFQAGAAALKQMAQELGKGMMPTVCRLSDEEETLDALILAGSPGFKLHQYCQFRGLKKPCLLIMVWEGHDRDMLWAKSVGAKRIIRQHGGVWVPNLLATKWEHGRFSGPYLRDKVMAHKLLAETLETATTWDKLMLTYRKVQDAILRAGKQHGKGLIVQCHISHVYESGASLYYTFVGPQAKDPLRQWEEIKKVACQAIVESGATISHHHSVGLYHRDYLQPEVSDLGLRLMHTIKADLDPEGILNPRKVVEE